MCDIDVYIGRSTCRYLKESVYPHLSAEQRVFVVPGTYASKAPDAATDQVLTAKFDLYWELAVKDPMVIGIKPCVLLLRFHLSATLA